MANATAVTKANADKATKQEEEEEPELQGKFVPCVQPIVPLFTQL
jgi:hypothetical protein